MPGITHWNHPCFFAYFPSNTSYTSILADLVASGLGAQGMSWQTSPAATEVEEVVMDWLRQMVGLSAAWTGVIHDTASTATFTALLCARERLPASARTARACRRRAAACGLRLGPGPQLHRKGRAAGGLRPHHLRLIPTDENHALRLDLLEAAIEKDLEAGRRPCALVACVGTTGTTALDPLAHGGPRGAARHVAPRGRRHGRHRHGAARVPLDVGGRRAGR